MRTVTMMALLSGAALLSACTSPGGDDARARGPSGATSGEAGCGACVEELADVRARVEELADVRELVALETYRASPTNGAGVRVELRARSTGDPAVVDEVGRIIWQSRLSPVDEVFVAVEDASGDLVRGSSPLDFTRSSRRHATYVEQWGERPVPR